MSYYAISMANQIMIVNYKQSKRWRWYRRWNGWRCLRVKCDRHFLLIILIYELLSLVFCSSINFNFPIQLTSDHFWLYRFAKRRKEMLPISSRRAPPTDSSNSYVEFKFDIMAEYIKGFISNIHFAIECISTNKFLYSSEKVLFY